mgnify:CR=1 FL=1
MITIVTITKDDIVGVTRTLLSAKGLRAAGVEHIVIDGGSEPGATDRLVAQMGRGVTVISRPPRGIADAFNAGIAAAQGEWLWFLNGGDAVHESLNPAWLLETLASSRASVIVGGIHYDGEGSPRFAPPLSQQWPLTTCWLPHPATLVRKDALLKAGGFDEKWAVAADYALWFRLLGSSECPDSISIPFARFDVTGVSQRAESRRVAHGDEAQVLLEKKWHLLREGFCTLKRVFHRLFWAIRHR